MRAALAILALLPAPAMAQMHHMDGMSMPGMTMPAAPKPAAKAKPKPKTKQKGKGKGGAEQIDTSTRDRVMKEFREGAQ